MNQTHTFTHYGAEVSLFSGKTRAYLRYKQIPFNEINVTAAIINQELYPQTKMRMIPILKSPEGEYVQDTTAIIDYLEQRFSHHSVYPSTPKQRFIALLLELYADEWLLLPAMHYRWHYKRAHLGFILREFGASTMPKWPRWLQPVAGLLPAFYFGRLYKPVLGISKRNEVAIEQWYERFLNHFDQHLQQHAYLFGERPSIADFGFFGPLYAHLYRDPYSGRLMRKLAPNVVRWVERMNQPPQTFGDWLPDDSIAETILPFVRHMLETQYPVLATTIERVAQRAEQQPNARLPRFLGKTGYQIEGVEEQRMVNTYAQWMLQRPLDYVNRLAAAERNTVEQWLALNGLSGLTSLTIKQPIERRHNHLFPCLKS